MTNMYRWREEYASRVESSVRQATLQFVSRVRSAFTPHSRDSPSVPISRTRDFFQKCNCNFLYLSALRGIKKGTRGGGMKGSGLILMPECMLANRGSIIWRVECGQFGAGLAVVQLFSSRFLHDADADSFARPRSPRCEDFLPGTHSSFHPETVCNPPYPIPGSAPVSSRGPTGIFK
jgi:hypothetical protein